MERDQPWATLLSVAGTAGAAVGLVYVVGGIVLSLRYEALGLTGQQAVALTQREVLLFAGLRSLAIWTLLGFILVVAIGRLPDGTLKAIANKLRGPSGLLVAGVIAVILFLVLRVWWPLATLGAVLVIIATTVQWRKKPVRRFLASAVAIALVAVAYEADRINYRADWTCIEVAEGAMADGRDAPCPGFQVVRGGQRVCGILIGQSDRGYYIGSDIAGTIDESAPYQLMFVPTARVLASYSKKISLRAIAPRARARRQSLPSRLFDIHVR